MKIIVVFIGIVVSVGFLIFGSIKLFFVVFVVVKFVVFLFGYLVVICKVFVLNFI